MTALAVSSGGRGCVNFLIPLSEAELRPIATEWVRQNHRGGTVAAACGGTTTVVDFVEPAPAQRLLEALSRAVLHERTDYTPYEGFQLQGYPVVTISRGTVLVRDGQLVGPKGHGRYLARSVPQVG